MNKKRISDRKSELRLDLQDFCLSLPENSDPIAGYLLSILQWQASLDIQTNSILHRAFVNQIDQLKCKLKMQLKHTKNKAQDNQNHNNNITKYISQFHKLKQVFSYCLILSKKESQLCNELQKFNEYKIIPIKLTEQLQNYLNQPIIFQTIFHGYLRAYNINILTADLISFLYAHHQQKIKTNEKKQTKIIKNWQNADIELLKNKSIMFKQLTDMNKKYIRLENQLSYSYIYHLCDTSNQIRTNPEKNVEEQIKEEQQILIKQKVKKLTNILNKIKNHSGLYNIQKQTTVIQAIQPLCSLRAIQITGDYPGSKIIQANKQFFLQILYNKSWAQCKIGDQQFTFMRQKIIKVQALFYLNRILSAINVISYVYNQLDLEIRQNYQFQFKNIRKLIGSQFINKETYNYKISDKNYKNAFFSIDNKMKAYIVIDSENNKILYPSAINYFFSFVKSMLLINFTNKQSILQLLQVKSEYLQSLAETIVNIYHLIKVKQLSCYKLLRQYIEIIRKSSFWNQLRNFENSQSLIRMVGKQKQKIGIISQIIYEFDHNYSIKQSLQELVKIQFDGLTKNSDNMFELYNSILSEIIQIRNGLKLDHYYSVNQIHQNFSLLPRQMEKQDQQKISKHDHIYFEDIIHQICTASQTILYLPKLFFFFDLQLKLKRVVFKLQLCWSCKAESIFDRKAQAFKDFINTYCAPIFAIINECRNVVQILQKMEQLQRYTDIFNQQVSRFHVIQKLVSLMSYYKQEIPILAFREQVNKLTLQDLSQLNTTLHIFNPIQCQKCPSRLKLVRTLSKAIHSHNSIRLTELPTYNPGQQKLRQNLASIIYLLHLIPSRALPIDHQTLISLYHYKNSSFDIYHIKQYQQIQQKYKQWLSCKNILELIQFNEELLVISILKTLREMEKQSLARQGSQDYKKLVKFMKKFQISSIFINLNRIQQIQFWRQQFGIMTKYHQIYQLMFHFDSFNAKIYGNLGKKLQYKDKKILNQQNHKLDYSSCQSDFMTKIYYIFQLKPLTRQRLQKNIQKLQQQILETESLHRSISYYHQKLKKKVYQIFCEQVYRMVNQAQINQDLGIKFDGSQQPAYYIDQLRKNMLKAVKEHKSGANKTFHQNFKQIQMFSEKKGYELSIVQQSESKQYKIVQKKRLERAKKPIISPQKLRQQRVHPLQDLKRKFQTQILKKSLHLRKQISKLQLSENKIRQQITWQTSKLQYSVIQKINQFIALSNVDQQQSYINFRHTVNLETIKGIENVIEEQTQMYMDKKNKALQQQNGQGFITQIENKQFKDMEEETGQKVDRSRKLLDANIDCMLSHMKKIKVFAAWKKTLKKTNLTRNQWCNFNMNVQNILNNDKIGHSILQIQNARNSYLKQNVTCQIMKEENSKINQKIQQLKMTNLQKKVKNYREKLLRQ